MCLILYNNFYIVNAFLCVTVMYLYIYYAEMSSTDQF
jgi:hypothetical protein